jgi:hypothetical protein
MNNMGSTTATAMMLIVVACIGCEKADIAFLGLLPRKMTVGPHLLGSLIFLQSEGQGDEQATK